jgi:uncharacterized protein YciI
MAELTWNELIEFCRQQDGKLMMMTKELYIVFSEPTNGLAPIMENIDEHLAYQTKLHNDGVMFAAGPVAGGGGSEYLGDGVFVYHADSLEQAVQIAESDPMHIAGARRFRVLPWLLNEGDLRV